jgi:hypothetical protein
MYIKASTLGLVVSVEDKIVWDKGCGPVFMSSLRAPLTHTITLHVTSNKTLLSLLIKWFLTPVLRSFLQDP